MPVFEIGSLWVAATLLYSTIPFINFIAAGLEWGSRTDGRLAQYEFDVGRIGAFAWGYAVYLASFVVVYLPVRARNTARAGGLDRVPRSTVTALLIIFAVQSSFEWLTYVVYDLDFNVSYSDLPTTLQPAAMPYILWQVTLVVFAVAFVVKQALLLVLIQQWNDLRWRLLLVGWLGFEVISVVLRMSVRGTAVRLLLTVAVLYHRFVRPWRPFWLVVCGGALLAGFLVQGILRGRAGLEGQIDMRTVLSSTNEFQVLFATAYDLYQRKILGTLPAVPWQVYVSDLYLIIPSQLLPFDKIDPSVWYLEVIGLRDTGVGFMFGVMAQAVLGFEWIELAGRGALLGLLFALLHRWYVRHAGGFWPTLLYLFVAVWSYYSFRATTFWFMHFVVYQFVPVMAATMLLGAALRRRRAGRAA